MKSKSMKTRSLPPCLLALAWLLGTALHSSAATLVVTNLADSGPGSLRDAITFANTNVGADAIRFDAALSGETNVLTSGQLTISDDLIIDASALPAGFKISGNHNSLVFEVAAAGVVTLNSMTIQDGYNSPLPAIRPAATAAASMASITRRCSLPTPSWRGTLLPRTPTSI